MNDRKRLRTASSDGYHQIREAIVAGHLQPNERLVESDISQRFGVPRAAVRNALVRLEQEGLIVREHNRGAKVRLVSEDEAVEILEARSVLEGLAARKAAERAGDADIAELRRLHRRMEDLLAAGELVELSEADGELHRSLVALSDHQAVIDLLVRLRSQTARFQERTILIPARIQASVKEHGELVEAIARRDPDGAEAAARGQLANTIEALRRTHPLG